MDEEWGPWGRPARVRQRVHAGDATPAAITEGPIDPDDYDPWDQAIPEALRQKDATVT